MRDIHQLFQAFVAPAIFVSAEGLLLLSLNVRLMGIVSRLRSYLHKKHDAAKQGRLLEAEAYASQIASIENRAELIRRSFVFTLYGLIGTIAACLLLGQASIGNGPKQPPQSCSSFRYLSCCAAWFSMSEKFKWPSVRCERKPGIHDSWTFRAVRMSAKKGKRPERCRAGCPCA